MRVEGKKLEKEWSVVIKALETLTAREEKGEGGGVDGLIKGLDKIDAKLKGVKRKLNDGFREQTTLMDQSCNRARLAASPATSGEENSLRHLTEYLLREGHIKTAHSLVKETGIEDHVDLNLFQYLCPITQQLLNKNATDALQWCGENRSRLKKVGSTIEFDIKLQMCADIGVKDAHGAVEYCTKNIIPICQKEKCYLDQVAKMLGWLVATDEMKSSSRYSFADPEKWAQLSEQFVSSYLRVCYIPETPLFLQCLQAGLLCLNTSKVSSLSVSDPLSNSLFASLAEGLPCMTRKNSVLLCRITGEVMDDNNPPTVTPQGYVYSEAGIEQSVGSGDTFTCPQTGSQHPVQSLRKVFVM
eukprot:TRINITY_DN7941_c0_g1_i1.p1 TRINITY_DN7941_c0_g1~~TRINITY_DN7941_c0_g1_i1.p1  ORF type:complete len:391 (+),score=47.41 TRINITY_DN7941_c0_g1_i1:104-1174(+)